MHDVLLLLLLLLLIWYQSWSYHADAAAMQAAECAPERQRTFCPVAQRRNPCLRKVVNKWVGPSPTFSSRTGSYQVILPFPFSMLCRSRIESKSVLTQVTSPALWLKLTASKHVPVEIDLCSSTFDTKVVLMAGEDGWNEENSSSWVIEDDSGACSMITDSTRSRMLFTAEVCGPLPSRQ